MPTSNCKCPICRVEIGSQRVWRDDSVTKKILDVLVNDVDQHIQSVVQARESQLKETFDVKHFSKIMNAGLEIQRKGILEIKARRSTQSDMLTRSNSVV